MGQIGVALEDVGTGREEEVVGKDESQQNEQNINLNLKKKVILKID